MEFKEAAIEGIVTAFWVGLEVYLLFNRYFAESLAYSLGISDTILEVGVFILGLLASLAVHWVLDENSYP